MIRNSEPFPSSLSTSMMPPMASTMYLVIAMPRPLPSVLRTRALSSRTKDSKMRALNSGVMPMPVSAMWKWMRMKSSPFSDGSSYIAT